MKKIEDYMRAKDIVRIYGISLSTVKNWQKTGKLKVLHVSSKKILFLKKEVEALFNPSLGKKMRFLNNKTKIKYFTKIFFRREIQKDE
ncbi:MAG: helix-turn-helix domain-containing protein [Campylobacterales bacterium]|nr:helix-turn-helix domain-containing protein [Campylobacterales bacterium]